MFLVRGICVCLRRVCFVFYISYCMWGVACWIGVVLFSCFVWVVFFVFFLGLLRWYYFLLFYCGYFAYYWLCVLVCICGSCSYVFY